jgi:NDP-sugar pyrophosphorylase family protein
MNVIVLMAGSSDLFQNVRQKYPKPLIEINGSTIIDRVIKNLTPVFESSDRVVFIIKKNDNMKFHIGNVINLLVPKGIIVEVVGETAGAACTALLAVEHLNDSQQLLIINGDQIIDTDYLEILKKFNDDEVDAGTIVFNSIHPRWSYVKLDTNNKVIEAAEKKPISKIATAGFYFFNRADEFSKYAKKMILKDANIEGSYYICPVFNEMVLDQKIIITFEIKPNQYHSFMSPETLINYKEYLDHEGTQNG